MIKAVYHLFISLILLCSVGGAATAPVRVNIGAASVSSSALSL